MLSMALYSSSNSSLVIFFREAKDSVVTALITREEYNSIQSEKFVEETFHGSLPAMVLSFASRKKMTKEEFDELYKAIESIQE